MLSCLERFLEEFRRDVVAVTRRRDAPQRQIAEDFGISHATLSTEGVAHDSSGGRMCTAFTG